jgi:mono/diheme cytochrome c family protein
VIAGLSRVKPIVPWASIAVVGLGLICFSGCDLHSYSKDMRYPVRDDVIVEKAPDVAPGFEQPGQLSFLLPSFTESGGQTLDPAKLNSEQRNAFQKTLDDMFGTPAEPTVKGIEADARILLKLDNDTLAKGSQLYRRHCLHCHGLAGGGNGPTAPWVNPHPRDYRPGRFKFASTLGDISVKPTRHDLLRTLRQGIEGTSMPSFGLLPIEELEALISYVIHLSVRGQVEYNVMLVVLKPDSDIKAPGDIISNLKDEFAGIVKDWQDAELKVMQVSAYALKKEDREQSVSRGYELFLGKVKGAPGCISCHVDYGRQNSYKFDVWGTVVRPRDLTTGVYRGGRRPIDLYWRIRGGIKAGAMPESDIPPDKVWDLVNFVQALPYPQMLPEDIRHRIYGTERTGSGHGSARRE